MKQLRSGERLALLAALALAVLLGLDWFFLSTPDARVGAHESGIRSLGWVAELFVVAAIGCGLTLAFVTVTQRPTALPIVFSVLTFWFALFATIAIAVRLIFQPTLGVEASAGDVEIELPAWLGLFSAIGLMAGGWIAMADERLDTAESHEQTEEVLRVRGAPRPAPPAGPS